MTDSLIGRKVKMIKTEREYEMQDGTKIPYVDYRLDDPDFVAEAKQLLGANTRILPPGSVVTMDYNPNRHNVRLDEDGIVTSIGKG